MLIDVFYTIFLFRFDTVAADKLKDIKTSHISSDQVPSIHSQRGFTAPSEDDTEKIHQTLYPNEPLQATSGHCHGPGCHH